MRTEIVYSAHGGYRRATRPTAAHAEDRHGSDRLPTPARFVPPYVEPRHKQRYIDFRTMKSGSYTAKARHHPARVHLGQHAFDFEYGVCKKVRIISDEYQMKLNALDEQIDALEQERRETVEDAYIHGRALRPGDIEAATAVYRAEVERRRAAKDNPTPDPDI